MSISSMSNTELFGSVAGGSSIEQQLKTNGIKALGLK